MEKARADAEKIKLIGAAEATAIENVGRSEAEAMRLKAAAYKQYGEAATLSLVFEALPKVRRMSLSMIDIYALKECWLIILSFVSTLCVYLLPVVVDRSRSCRSSSQDGRDRHAEWLF